MKSLKLKMSEDLLSKDYNKNFSSLNKIENKLIIKKCIFSSTF